MALLNLNMDVTTWSLEAWGYVAQMLLVVVALFIFLSFTGKRGKHKVNLIRARFLLWRLSQHRCLHRLRKCNPYVFEEAILTCLKRRGIKIKRNKSYTHDYGIDGQFVFNKQPSLIQAKRYRNYASLSDIKRFKRQCSRKNAKGLFVTTGKVGLAGLALEDDHVQIVTCDNVVEFLVNEPFNLFGVNL
ncbi:MAG: restriction endonuclease [Pseudomonadales bacterium]|nr:restriction endonuclease [Pseudomonadales bacterium]